MCRSCVLVIHLQAFLRAYFNTIAALDARKTLDAPGRIRFSYLDCSGRASSFAHAAEDTVVDVDLDLTSGTFEIFLRLDWILCCIRTME